jgi:hypothetical protein
MEEAQEDVAGVPVIVDDKDHGPGSGALWKDVPMAGGTPWCRMIFWG